MRYRSLAGVVFAVVLAARPLWAQAPVESPDVRFVVLGHIRGDQSGGLNPKLPELLEEARRLDPQFAVLTGDIIWGDSHATPPDPDRVTQDWIEVDEALDTLGIPVYRVPGNHDISDVGSRDVWLSRYGPLPRAVSEGGVRLILLSSAWIPEDGDPRVRPFIRGVDLDTDQLEWLRAELERPTDEPTFVFMHHLLWWEEDGQPWWRDVHPLLVRAGVLAVFTGDYGPLKFSTTERDGLRYYQTSMEPPVGLAMLQINESSRLLSAQFDNFLEVIAHGATAEVRVHTIGEVSSGEFTPDRYEAIQGPPPTLWSRLMDFAGTPRRIAVLAFGGAFAFGVGLVIGRLRR